MGTRILFASLLLAAALGARGQGRDWQLPALIEALREQGHTILYSSALVHGEQTVRVETVDIEALRRSLPALGLELTAESGVWVITAGDSAVETTPPVLSADAPPGVLETVIVTGTRHHFPAAGVAASSNSYRAEDLAQVPALGSDRLRATLRLPGVSSVGVSAKPRIRGGLQDELLVMQDGVELLEPFHLADYHSAYSAIDYHTVETLDVYTGGFPSRYGNRMSGVMDIRNRWQPAEYNTDIGVSSFANFIHSHGELGRRRPTRWALSLRQGDLSDLTEYIGSRSGKPEYADAAGRLSIELNPQLQLDGGLVYGEDDILFEDEEERAESRIETRYAWLGGDWTRGENLASRVTLSWLDFRRDKLLSSFEVEEDPDSFEDESKGGFLDHRQRVERWALRQDVSLVAAQQFFELGWQAEYNRGDYRHVSRIDRGELADVIDTERLVRRDIDLQASGWSGGAYAQLELPLGPGLLIQPSLRWDWQDYYLGGNSEAQWSPRLGLAWEASEALRLRLSLGRFNQPESIQELQVLDGVTRFFKPQRSDQVVAGLEWQHGGLRVTTEAYYKDYGRVKGRFENMFNPFVLLPEMEPDRVGLLPDRARARGADLDIRWRWQETFGSHLRYSYMDAEDRLATRWIPRRWSQRHTVNTGVAWQLGSFRLSLAATWHSGWRSTRLPDYVPEGAVVTVESVLNNVELGEYFSLDLGISKYWEIGRTRLTLYADISNLTDRDNAAGIDWDVEEDEDRGGFLLTPDAEVLLGRVPSVGATLSF